MMFMPHVHTKELLILYVAIFNCLTYPEKKNNNYNCIHLLILDISFNKSCVLYIHVYVCMYMYFNTSRCCGHCFTVFFFFLFLGVNRVKLLDMVHTGVWRYIIGRLVTSSPVDHFLNVDIVYDLDVYETHLTTIYIKFSAFLYPSYVLPIAKRHSGIFSAIAYCMLLHKHFVLTNGHVFFFFFGQF